MPQAPEAPLSVVGKPTPRVDGPQKVSGQALYTSDFSFPGMLYAVPVAATIGILSYTHDPRLIPVALILSWAFVGRSPRRPRRP